MSNWMIISVWINSLSMREDSRLTLHSFFSSILWLILFSWSVNSGVWQEKMGYGACDTVHTVRSTQQKLHTGPQSAHSNCLLIPRGIQANLFHRYQFVITLEQELDYLGKEHEGDTGQQKLSQPQVHAGRHTLPYRVTGQQESWHASSQRREECISVSVFDENNEIESASILFFLCILHYGHTA